MNKKSTKERAQILGFLIEGNSLHATTRMIRDIQGKCSINTVFKLLEEVGEACSWYQHKYLVNLSCECLYLEEIWSFSYSGKQGTNDTAGNVWIWTALCADTKLVPSWWIGSREASTMGCFISDLSSRMLSCIPLERDDLKKNKDKVKITFDVEGTMFGRLLSSPLGGEKSCESACLESYAKNLASEYANKNNVESKNFTMHMSMRGFEKLTTTLHRRLNNHGHTIALHFMHYNFVQIQKKLSVTPAIAAGVCKKPWNLEDIVNMSDNYWQRKIST